MHFWDLLTDIGILLGSSLILGAIAIRLGLSPLVGYLVSGMFLGGSGSLHIIQAPEEIEAISELGVSLLLFSLGLEFSWNKIKTFSVKIINAGIFQILLTPILVFALSYFLKLDWKLALVLGLILTLSSTAAVLRTLIDLSEQDSSHGRIVTAVLLLQDIAVIPFTIIVSLMSSSELAGIGLQEKLLYILGGALALVFCLYVLLHKLSSPVLSLFSLENNREMSILLAIIICIGSAWAAHQIGISPAIGAFIAGMMLGTSPFATQITADISPLRVIFLTLFFSSIGIIADPVWIMQNFLLVFSISIFVIILKSLISFSVFSLSGNTIAVSFASALCIAQIGEFAFVLTNLAEKAGILSTEVFQMIISVTIVTLFLSPSLIKFAPGLSLRLQRIFTKKYLAQEESSLDAKYDIFLLGFGVSGSEVARFLKDSGHERIKVLDLNRENVNRAEAQGFSSDVGDVRQLEVLQHHGMQHARLVVITTPSRDASVRAIDNIRKLAPGAHIKVRSRYQAHNKCFENAGVNEIVSEELTVGALLGSSALEFLQAQPSS